MSTVGCDPWAVQEMAGVQTWDGRCRSSLTQICHTLVSGLGDSWSKTLGHRLRQSASRILKDPRTTGETLLKGHLLETASRAAGLPLVLVAQDTTEFDFSTHPSKTEMGRLRFPNSRGLLAHGVLALSPAGVPLGVVGISFFERARHSEGKPLHRNHRTIDAKESKKWLTGLEMTEAAFEPTQALLLIQDREADLFAFLAAPRRSKTNLLIRAARARHVQVADPQPDEEPKTRVILADAIAKAPVLGRFCVSIPRRPQQEERSATLELRLRAMSALAPANQLPGEPSTPQDIWVVQVTEVDPPEGVPAVNWTLISTLPVLNFEEAQQMVRYYTLRWMVERLHYTLKSGCQAEKMQIEAVHTVQNALALLYIVAWRVLFLTYAARTHPEHSTQEMLSLTEITVLGQISKKDVTTIQKAVTELARIGGYQPYRNAPPPGVKTIWLGLRSLSDMVQAWNAAIQYVQAQSKDMNQD